MPQSIISKDLETSIDLAPFSTDAGDAPRRFRPDEGAAIGPEVHLLLSTNARYLQHVAVCVTSLLTNNPDLLFDIVIVHRPTESLDEGKLRRSLSQFSNYSLALRQFALPADRLPMNPHAHYTVDTWARLWVEEFFPDDVDRVLYFDGDIVVVGSIAELWRAELDGALLGTVDIPGSDRGVTNLGLHAEDGYFNAGVLIIDLKQWRDTRALDTVLRYVDTYPERMVPDVDQEALNGCFHDRRKRLDYKWNTVWSFFDKSAVLPLAEEQLERVRQEARVIHFNGFMKPWSYFCFHPRKREYEKYLRMTEWRDFVPDDRTAFNIVYKRMGELLPQDVKRLLKKAGLARIKPNVAL
jgi:lipopolysaccharide biosynthesis glycosyltransferase